MATTSNFGVLLIGRFILGFAVALSAIAECIYIAEISTPEKRGDKNNLSLVLINVMFVT